MAEQKNNRSKSVISKQKKSKNASFFAAVTVLVLLIVVPVVFLLISTFLNRGASNQFNETLYPMGYSSLVSEAAREYDVDECLIYGVIRTESNFNSEAVSPVGAVGLMQIMPETFTWLQNYRTDFQPEEILDSEKLFDPAVNIDYGVFMLSYLLSRYDGNESLAVCAYNAGHGNVDSWIDEGIISVDNVAAEDIPFTETSNYLNRVMSAKEMYNMLYFAESREDYTSE